MRKKTKNSIDKKSLKLDEARRRKTDLQKVKNIQNLAKKTGRKIDLIKDREERLLEDLD